MHNIHVIPEFLSRGFWQTVQSPTRTERPELWRPLSWNPCCQTKRADSMYESRICGSLVPLVLGFQMRLCISSNGCSPNGGDRQGTPTLTQAPVFFDHTKRLEVRYRNSLEGGPLPDGGVKALVSIRLHIYVFVHPGIILSFEQHHFHLEN